MTVPVGGVIRPYVQTEPVTLMFWILINVASFAFELIQWQERRAEATRTDGGGYGLLLTCAGIGLGVLASAPALVPGAAIQPTPVAFATGMAMFLAGFGMRRWSEMTLGRYFTFAVMTSAEQPVITSGPYRFVRHPGYTGVILVVLGAGLIAGNWVGLAGWTLLVTLPLLHRIHIEENALLSALGDRYAIYAAQHKRLVPLIW